MWGQCYTKLRQINTFIRKAHKQTYAKSAKESIEIIYKDHGDPVKVLHIQKLASHELDSDSLRVKMLAAPVNPADINMIQGVYPIKPPLPAVGGNEGVGKVIETGPKVQGFKAGDLVVPSFSGKGTWREEWMCKTEDLLHVADDIPVISAATLSVNPCTAYRMLKDFETLHHGDVVIQNAANSGVGQAVIQIAAVLNLQTVNIVRNRPEIEKLKTQLKSLGDENTHVITDEFLRSKDMKEFIKTIPKPKLALNGVGGKASANLLKYLEKHGSMVTYGGMSKLPLMVPAGPLIFNDVKLRGFWMTRWNDIHGQGKEKQQMWDDLCDMIRNGKLQTPSHRLVRIENFLEAVGKAMEPFTSEKQILIME